MLDKIKIQKPNPEDADQIGEVYYKTWIATYPNKEFNITIEDIEYMFRDRKGKDGSLYLNLPETVLLLVAKDGDLVVGVCRLIKHDTYNQLKAIYVLPQYQGNGIGKMFWNEAIKFFDFTKETIVQAVTYNKNAIEFYKKLGFKETGKVFYDETFRMRSGVIPPETELNIPPNTL